MAFEINEKGITINTYSEIFNDQLVRGYQNIYGNDIMVDVNSPDGQVLGIFAKIYLDLQTAIVKVYNSQDVDFAIGVDLDRLSKLFGVLRRPPVKATWQVEVDCSETVTLPLGFVVEDSLKQKWSTFFEYNLKPGKNTISLFSEEYGAIQGSYSDILSPVTIISGINYFKPLTDAIVGIDEENDILLRNRLKKSTSINSQSTIGAMYSKLANLSDVRDVKVYENNTNHEKDTIPPHSLWIIVNGGDVSEIVETIVKNKTGGTGLKGNISGVYLETLTREDGSTYIIEHSANYDNPTVKKLYLKLEVKRTNPFISLDTESIKNNLTSYSFLIGENVITSRFYELAYRNQKDLIVENLQISSDNSVFVTDEIIVNLDELYSLTVDNIEIVER